jgi:steroid 5-alpha reductase family enzyme
MRGRFAIITLAYAVALAVAVAVGASMGDAHPIAVAAAGDVAGTLVIFAFSFTFRNSSFYDAYWSVAPLFIGLYWLWAADAVAVDPVRAAVVLGLVGLWGARLTYNWARGWSSLDHEDWRYVDLQQKMGKLYWPVSLLGLHTMPTVLVFLGCLPLYAALLAGARPFGWLDGVACVVTFGAIALEATADQQLARFRREQPPGSQGVLRSGLWAWSRHPNYCGEVLFWWGVFGFGLAAAPQYWWTVAGAVSITLLFRFVSLPMIETRMLARRPEFAAVQQQIPILIPRPPKA